MPRTTEPRKRKNKRAYLNDYKLNSEGKYQYQGLRYHWTLEENEGKQLTFRLRLFGIALIVMGILCGCIPVPGMGNWVFLILPYIASLAAELSLCIAVLRMCHEGNPLRAHVYEKSVGKIPERTFFCLATSVIMIVAEIIYLAGHGTEGMLIGAIVFFVLQVLIIAAASTIKKVIKPLQWDKY